WILVQINAGIFLEFAGQILDQAQVEVFTTQVGVTVGGQHFELVLAVDFGNFDDGDIESTTTQVVDRDHGVTALLVHAISQGRSSGLVDDALDFQTGDTAGVFGGLTLAVIEVCRYGDDRLGDRLTQVIFRSLLHLFQHFGRNLRRGHFLRTGFDPGITIVGLDDLVRHAGDVFLDFVVGELAADQTLHRVQGVVGVGNRLTLGRLTHQRFVVFAVSNDGRGGAITFAVFDDLGLVALHD